MTSPQTQTADEGAAAPAKRVYYFDYIRVWATFGVVVLHSSALIFTRNAKRDVDFVSKFTIADFGDALGRFGVGCFFMVSGALLLAPQHRFRLGKQLLRVAIPLVVWSVVYALFQAYFVKHHLPRVNGSDDHPLDVVEVIKSFFARPLFYHLWFVYVLIGIYLVIPLLRPLTALPAERRAQLLRYGLLLWAAFTIVVPLLHEIWPGKITLYTPAFPAIPAGFLGMAVFGFYLHHHDVPIRSRGLLLFGCAAGLTTGALVVFYDLTHHRPTAWGLNDLTPQIVLYSACVFLLGKIAFDRPGRAYPFVALFSRLSYRIYLIHALVLHYLRAISPMKHFYLNDPVLSIPTMLVLTIAISFAISWLLDQIKPIRNYI